ncbi:hypothetical protein [Streptomyces sp. UNOC14_S4]|uniref:hypothetical protein n=1 Tax=Streptomyces sp. UNOC14_S4 TaxID=2872340 RepID=UPI001E4FF78B|nr:hypothetical protein [Streptomyces sp. UNOC14_S4]MCC3770519.1 hypothetical protein [Streptomyces sp. UNOC14_S4]
MMDEEACRAVRERTLRHRRESPLFEHLHRIAGGVDQLPIARVAADEEFLSGSDDLTRYHEIFQRNMGTFYEHFAASIPFILEEQCRIGVGMHRLAQQLTQGEEAYLAFRETSVGDGTNGRTMAEFSEGLIRTLSCSSSIHNKTSFDRLCSHDCSRFHQGSFVEVTPEYIASRPDLHCFRDGFDVIYENVTFQFYGPERADLIGYVSRQLKPEGVMIFMEKLRQPDPQEYLARERIKDELFKSRYFRAGEISAKRVNMLVDMERGQVDFALLVDAIEQHFEHAYLIWNSTNFYEFAASNSAAGMARFLSVLDPVHVPAEFRFERDLPRAVQSAA